jgi:hypothetical protein
MRSECHEEFPNPFILKTRERFYELYTTLKQEREMWISSFKYVVKSCKVVQQIVKMNDQQMKAKMEQDKESIHLNAIDRANSYQKRNVEGTKAPLNFTNTIQR